MRSFRIFGRRVGSIVAALALVVATAVPGLVSAAQVTTRSIELSTASAAAQSVTYKVKFTSVQSAGAFVIDFCSNTPLLGESCTAPAGFSVENATSATSGFTDVGEPTDDTDHNTVRVTGTVAATTAIEVDLAAVNNPTSAGTIYARIITYDTAVNANLYDPATVAEGAGGVRDNGSVAISIRPTIAVSGAVLETMTFCVSADEPTQSCGGATSPVLALGRDVGNGVIALDNTVSEGTLYTQISTNATGGAVINLKSSAVGCGGLIRAGAVSAAAGCGIAPALAAGVADGEAKFGVKTTTAAGVGGSSNGTLRPYDSGSGAYYSNSTYKLRYVSGDADGVTSTYGDPFLDTNGAPANNMNMELTFGAAISNSTPAGKYSTNLSLIATGKF